jgi:hypothetical protein
MQESVIPDFYTLGTRNSQRFFAALEDDRGRGRDEGADRQLVEPTSLHTEDPRFWLIFID